MKILSFTTYPVVNPLHGGQRRIAAFNDFYRSQGVDFHTACVYQAPPYRTSEAGPNDIPMGYVLPKWAGMPFMDDVQAGEFAAGSPGAYRHFRRVVERIRPDALQLDHPYMWPLIARMRAEDEAIARLPLIYSSHNWEGPLKANILTGASVAHQMARDVGAFIEAMESEIARAANLIVAVSDADAARYAAIAPRTPVRIVANGVGRPLPRAGRETSATLAHFGHNRFFFFVGSAYPPNIDGFANLVAAEGLFLTPPEKHFAVCGAACEGISRSKAYQRFLAANSERLQFFPDIDDYDLGALKAAAHVVLLPIQFGGGSNLKTAEALAAGKHVVATSVALRGFERFADAAGVRVADSPAAFRQAMIEALAAPPLVLGLQDTQARDVLYWDSCFAASGLAEDLPRLAELPTLLASMSSTEGLDASSKNDDADGPPEMKVWVLVKAYHLYGRTGHPRFDRLPAHDVSPLHNYLVRNAARLDPKWMIDIGADIGLACMVFCDVMPEGAVLAVEPNPQARGWLETAVSVNHLRSRVTISEDAVDDHRALVDLLSRAPEGRGLVHIMSEDARLEALAPFSTGADGQPPCVFFRLSLRRILESGETAAQVLDRIVALLGPLGVVDELSGLVSPLADGAKGEAQLRTIDRGPSEIFSLVNRLDLAELDERPPWTKPEIIAIRQGQVETIRSIGEVVADYEVSQTYPGAIRRAMPVRRWPLAATDGDTTLNVFTVPNAVVTSCYYSIDPIAHRLFGNQTYFEVGNWFNIRPRIDANRYEFRSHTVVPVQGRCVVIGGPIDEVYYHWLLNWCPRLTLLEMLAPEIYNDPTVRFMIDSRAKNEPFASFLRILNIPQERILWSEDTCDYVIEEGIIVSFLEQTSYYPDVIEAFLAKIRQGLPAPCPTGSTGRTPRRFWISRSRFDVPKRRMINLPEIEPVLRAYGFEPAVLEDMSVEEQIALFSGAETVIGVHGAGLANMVFCSPDCRLILLENQRNLELGLSRMFSVLAEICGLEYRTLKVKEDIVKGADYSQFGQLHNRDVIVPIRTLRGALEHMFGKLEEPLAKTSQPAAE